MPYPVAFLEIQLAFARTLARLTGQPFGSVALRNTALYRILGLDWSLNPLDPVWRSFIQAAGVDGSAVEAAYGIYTERAEQGLIPEYDSSRPHWGCFSYEYHPDSRSVRLHFANLDTSGYGPLSSQRREARMADLRALFIDVANEHPNAKRVNGGSWLYNRREYTRLFPKEYGDSARYDRPRLIGRGLWGQFLRHGNRMNEDVTASFLTRLAELRDAESYAACFPYQALLTDAPIQLFYAFYGVQNHP